MIRRARVLAVAGVLATACPPVARAQAGAFVQKPPIADRGRGRYAIGRVKVDRVRQRLAVRGVVLRSAPPLEFLMITADGAKAYESLVRVRANAHEFNLGCILIGLDPDKAKAPERHFDPTPADGDPVDVRLAWSGTDGRRTTVDVADLVRSGDQTLPRGEWVYTGSRVLPDGRFLAAVDGTLVGFVHDPAAVIEHRTGFLGQFDRVTVDPSAPPVGTRVTLLVARPR